MKLNFGLKQYIPLAATVLSLATVANAATAYINQIGYRPADPKEFALVDGSGDIEIVNAAGQTVLQVTPKASSYWAPSTQNVQLVDFTALTVPGTYSIKQGGQVLRSDLKIADKTFEDVTKAALKWYYYQRASMELEEQYAGQWKRAAGHTNSTVTLHNSTGTSGTIQSSKGWYDAGDYGRYIVNSGITTYTLLSLYEHFPEYFNTLKWNIPAEGTLPDLLAEIKYNLDWMLTMQAADGGVYHKLSTLQFPGDVMPAKDTEKLYVIGKGTAASFDFAGVMATTYRVFKTFDATYAAQCLEAAKKAYAWGLQNPNKAFTNPSDVATGSYSDGELSDEKAFASMELFISTGDASYKPTIDPNKMSIVPAWPEMYGLAVYAAATHATEVGADAETAKQMLLQYANEFAYAASSGFGVVMSNEDFVWGSNAVAGNQGVFLLYAYYVTGEQKYYEAAKKVIDYLLGKNPLDMSFLTGFGTKSPKLPHHRPSTADKITDPVPGMIVGGPQPGGEDIGSKSWECKDYRTGVPATSYTDNRCSYATNEVAINWNAPFAYIAGALEALNAGYAPSFAAPGVAKGGTSAIKPVVSRNRGKVEHAPRLRFDDQKVFIEKSGKRFDLKGNHLK
ncbi:cellulase [Fibrobacter succinogenes subsp. succinogenes S85]|uniref:Endoglucanase n=1 Tax=Fibrobacter succinogenes (strain ATCC 19169 / S85) TaxID=59374 RepID=A7UG67_FIBSS|nr:glycoside hydrolase family 9 protein [Fibrobacter succinogenes]ABU45498.1 endoglucanase 1 [Fibrobacter succinogenes subsp. succinogenes S85]ADL26362.1 cellulase [Fibrobacter succinogenes subsp. succinogenes S85]